MDKSVRNTLKTFADSLRASREWAPGRVTATADSAQVVLLDKQSGSWLLLKIELNADRGHADFEQYGIKCDLLECGSADLQVGENFALRMESVQTAFIRTFRWLENKKVISSPSRNPGISELIRYSRIKETTETGPDGQDLKAVNVVLFNECDWKCCFCPNTHMRSSQRPGDPDENVLERIMELAPKWKGEGIRNICLTGNEPLNHPQYVDIANFCTDVFDRVSVQTVGTKLLDEGFLGKLNAPARPVYQLPLYSSSVAVHDEVTGVAGSFDRISALISNPGFTIMVHTVVLLKNVSEIDGIRKTCDRHGRELECMILYNSTNRSAYLENAPKLSDAAAAVRAVTTDEEYAAFVDRNRFRIPACVSRVRSRMGAVKCEFSSSNGTAFDIPAYNFENPDVVKCANADACAEGGTCPGVYSTDIEKYGWGEFAPV